MEKKFIGKPKPVSEAEFTKMVSEVREVVIDNKSGAVFVINHKGEKDGKQSSSTIMQCHAAVRAMSREEVIMSVSQAMQMTPQDLLHVAIMANAGGMKGNVIKSVPKGYKERKVKNK